MQWSSELRPFDVTFPIDLGETKDGNARLLGKAAEPFAHDADLQLARVFWVLGLEQLQVVHNHDFRTEPHEAAGLTRDLISRQH